MGQDLSPIDGDAVRRLIAQMGETPKDVLRSSTNRFGRSRSLVARF